jgi:hypothetical protein
VSVEPICVTCGLQYAEARRDCPICEDERQYVGWSGQRWTTLEELQAAGHRGRIAEEGAGLVGIGTDPPIAIGQRALLVQRPAGNVLWDCITYLDDDVVSRVKALGGLSAIAISHPHYYGTMIEWSRAFGAPIYLHAADKRWVPRPDPAIKFWEGEALKLGSDVTLINAGVHFAGGTVLHWQAGERGAGALLSGDIFQVVMDRSWVSFMYSYPNLIPERPATVRRAVRLVEPFAFECVYGAWWGRTVGTNGAAALRRSSDRYLRFVLDE